MAFLILQAYRVSPRLKTIVFDKDRGLDIMVRAAGGRYMTLEPGGLESLAFAVEELVATAADQTV
ncbi:hypothetical protein [Rhizobium leguminosarum]|uniref:hypothetical protein n=1 Tax=Rhizobium leguminosarum TaxID=384 RepID=UPI0013DF2A0A|nr:hypothetical protein [Rhizobium leguminosarum]